MLPKLMKKDYENRREEYFEEKFKEIKEKATYYNKENKCAWIEESGLKDIYLINTIFSSAELYEKSMGKDLSLFNQTEILDFYTSLGSVSIEKLYNVGSYLRQYTDWCIVNELVPDKQNNYCKIETEELRECLNKEAIFCTYFTRKQLIEWSKQSYRVDTLVNTCDLAIVWLLFEGVRGPRYTDIAYIRFGDVDYETHKIMLPSGKELQLSKECTDIVLEASHEYSYILPSLRQRPFLDDRILRSFQKNQLEREGREPILLVRLLSTRIKWLMSELGMSSATLKSIIANGQIDMIKRLAKEAKMEVKDYILTPDCYDAIYNQYGVKTWVGSKFYAKYKDQLERED